MDKLVFRSEVSPVRANKTIGPVRSHLYGFVIARKMKLEGHHVTYIMKCDDSDLKKHRKEDFCDVYKFLCSLGIEADIHPYNAEDVLGCSLFQSERATIYDRYINFLLSSGLAFSDADSGFAVLDIGRFVAKYSPKIEVEDLLLGKFALNVEEVLIAGQRTIPLRRSDGTYLFNFASVVDDGEFVATHIVRGQDKIHVILEQEIIRKSLGFPSLVYIHLPLLCDEVGKRTGGYMEFDDFLRAGIVREAIISYILSSGYGDPDHVFLSLGEFIANFSIADIHKKNTRFCAGRLEDVNRRILRMLSSVQYVQSIRLYACMACPKIVEEIQNQDTQQFLAEFRMSPEKSVELLDRIFFPKEILPDVSLIGNIRQMAEMLKSDVEFNVLCNEFSHLSKDIFSRSLRWVLTRETGGIELRKIFDLLRKRRILERRAKDSLKLIQ